MVNTHWKKAFQRDTPKNTSSKDNDQGLRLKIEIKEIKMKDQGLEGRIKIKDARRQIRYFSSSPNIDRVELNRLILMLHGVASEAGCNISKRSAH